MYIIYVNNTLPLAHEISRHFWAAYGRTHALIPLRLYTASTILCKPYHSCQYAFLVYLSKIPRSLKSSALTKPQHHSYLIYSYIPHSKI